MNIETELTVEYELEPCIHEPCSTCSYNTGELLCEMEHYETEVDLSH